MEYKWSIDPQARIATVRAHGPFDLEKSLEAPRRVAADPAYEPDFGVVVDLRDIEMDPAAEDVVAIGQNLIGVRDLFRGRVALVVSSVHELPAELSAAIAGSGGFELSVFSDPAEAQHWVERT